MIQTKRLLGYSLLLTLLYIIWILPGYWNLGFTIINTLFLIFVAREYRVTRKDSFTKTVWWLNLALGGFMALRNFELGKFLMVDTIVVLNVMLVAIAKKQTAKLDNWRVIRTGMGLIPKMFNNWSKALSTLLRFQETTKDEKYKKILVGVVTSIPLLLIFGGLFYGADPIFAKLVDSVRFPKFNFDFELLPKILSTLVFWGVLLATLKNKLPEQKIAQKWLNSFTELNITVAILEVLFLVFSFIQIKYFLATADDLKKMQIVFSEYTRNGYSQMILASILAYFVVLRLEFSIRSQEKMGLVPNKITRILTWLMMGEILIFVVAATKRNYIYQSFYGFTETRLMGFALSAWLVMMLGLLAYKIWQKKLADYFTRGLILVTALCVLGINIVDIDGLIVRSKPASYDWGVDYTYMTYLSDDAWQGWEKIMVDAEDEVRINFNGDSNYTVRRLVEKKAEFRRMKKNYWNWGGNFNYSTMLASNFLEKNSERLEKLAENVKKQQEQIQKDFEEKMRNEEIKGTNVN